MSQYFGRKSPKAAKAREAREDNTRKEPQVLIESEHKILPSLKGAQSPLPGDLGCPQRHPNADPEAGRPSEASGGGSEERGSSTRQEGRNQKRTKKVLERWPPGLKEGARILEGKARTPRKARAPRQQGGLRDIRQWFERGSKPSQATSENQKECGSKEPQ